MARHYSTRDFFRQMPNRLLSRYFERQGLFAELNLAGMRELKVEPLLDAWQSLPDEERKAMDAEFREIYDLSCEKGFCAIRDEAGFHLRESPEALAAFVEKLATLEGHFERAMVTFLEYPQFWKGATHFCHADTLSWWRKRKGLPKVEASVHADGRDELARMIRSYFRKIEGRGNNCVVDAFRRRGRDYFFAYPEDYSQKAAEWVENKLVPRRHNPPFEVIFVYSQAEGTLDVNCRGSSNAIVPLQEMFITAILKLPEIPPDAADERVYDLNPLRERGFKFVYDPASGIQSVVLKSIRLSSKVVRGDRVTLEADTSSTPDAIYDLLEKDAKSIPLRQYYVTQVEILAKVTVEADRPGKPVTIRITHPNSCSLKYDDLDLKLRAMLADSGIEPKEPGESLEPESVEADLE
jgi:hypothetical protein